VTNSENSEHALYAYLIGIDFYLPNKLPDGGEYRSLGGCVGDISRMEDFLQRKLGILKDHLFKLTSTYNGTEKPMESEENWPTYRNIIANFQKIITTAQPGDQVFIHYSGHGGRTSTAYPDLKGQNGLDEALVPMDIGYTESNYLRDVQLAYLLKSMVDKGVIVTVVLDSCHSGGATRGNAGAVKRGVSNSITGIDTKKRTIDELVAPINKLVDSWQGLATTRDVNSGAGWLLEPKGYVLLAACRASESAVEYAFNGFEPNGVLTYWLLDSLKQLGPGLSYKVLHDRLLAKVHSRFPEQTPQLQGEGDRMVFGSEKIQSVYAVLVTKVDQSKNRIQLNAGQAGGLRKGAKFAVYPLGTLNFDQTEQRLALAEITELGAVDSWAQITNRLRQDKKIEQGAQAVFLETSDIRLQRSVKVLIYSEQTNVTSTDFEQSKSDLEKGIEAGGQGFLRVASETEPADFQVAINVSKKEFEIWDPSGKELPNLRPSIKVDDPNGIQKVVSRLVHLSKYMNIAELENNDAQSPLANKLQVELIGMESSDYDPADKANPKPFASAGDIPTIIEGEWAFLHIKNDLKAASPTDLEGILNITILDLQPNWGITQIYPAGAGSFEPFDSGHYIDLPLKASLSKDYLDGTDTLKVFATKGTTNFRWLELPPLDQPASRGVQTREITNPLEKLLSAFTANSNNLRDVNPAAYPSKEWTTAQVRLRIQKPKK
jgi:hypothetical protein